MLDSHTHLNDERLSPIIEEIVSSLPMDGVEAVINIGYDLPSSRLALEQARDYPSVYAAIGCHPHDSKDYDREFRDWILSVASHPKVVAIGETGLDYYYDNSERDVQRRAMREHIELADSLRLPLVLHIREAHGDALAILRDMERYLTHGVQVHCYSGSVELVREYSRFDSYFSFGGAITFKNADKGDIVRAVPRDRLLIETDAPYMTPVPMRGKTNEPKLMRYTLVRLAELLDRDVAEVDEITTANAKRLFGI